MLLKKTVVEIAFIQLNSAENGQKSQEMVVDVYKGYVLA